MHKLTDHKRILFLFNTGDVIGGGELSFFDLLANLDKERYEPFIVCPYSGTLVQKLEKNQYSVKIIEMPSIRKLNVFKIISGIKHLSKWIQQNQIKLIHANGSRCALYAVLAAKIAKVPIIWHVRILDKDPWLDPILSKLSNLIIVNSNAVKKRFAKSKKAFSKTVVIYNGIDFKKLYSSSLSIDLRKDLSISSHDPVIGMIGRTDLYKDHETLLYSVKEVIKSIPKTKLLLIGDGEKYSQIKKLSEELNISKSVYFLGVRDNIVDFYKALDVFVLSSKSEGFGRVLVEAMAIKRPVIGTNIGGIPEIIENNVSGILVPKNEPNELAQAILNLIQNPKFAKRLAYQAEKQVHERFCIDTHVKNVQQIYDSII